MKLNESQEQQLIFDWTQGPWDGKNKERIFELAPCIQEGYLEAQLLFAIPNGAWLRDPRQGVFMKRRGLSAGVFDMLLPVTIPWGRCLMPGLFIELKAEGGSISEKQIKFAMAMRSQGYATQIEWGHKNAIKAIKTYLDIREQQGTKSR